MADNHPLRHRVSKFYRARQLLRAASQNPLPPWAQPITDNDVQLAHRWCDLLDDGWVEDPDPPMVDDQGRDIGERWPATWATSSKSLKTFLTKYFRGLWVADLARIELEVARAAEERDEDKEEIGQAPQEVGQPQHSPSSPVNQAFDNDDDDHAGVNRSMRGLNLNKNTRVQSQSQPRSQRESSQSCRQEEPRQQFVDPAGVGPVNDYQIPGAFVDDNGDEENQEEEERNTKAGSRSRRLSGGPSSSFNPSMNLKERQHRRDKRLLSKYIWDFHQQRAKMKGQGEDKGRAVE